MAGFRLNAPPHRTAWVLVEGEPVAVELAGEGSAAPLASVLVAESGQVWKVEPWRVEGSHAGVASTGAILSPMPGMVIAVAVTAGERVVAGQRLLTLEAMKMEHTLTAPFDGVVAELNVVPGARVQVEALLARIVADA
jgi:3-methylcrotonyl-CoA carboxylase alpha subunit